MAPPVKKVSFDSYEKQIKHPFVIYARIETILVEDPTGRFLRVHKPCGFAYSIKCAYDETLSKYEDYAGEDCMEVFWRKIEDEANDLAMLFRSVAEPKMNNEQKRIVGFITKCYLCAGNLNTDKREDYCRISGEFLGVAHAHCRERRHLPTSVLVVIENLIDKDLYLYLLKDVPKNHLFVIGRNTNKPEYGFSRKNFAVQLRFIDSLQFLKDDLWELADILSDSRKFHLKKAFPVGTQFDLIKKKIFFPYYHVASIEQLEEQNLPNKKGFYNQQHGEDIPDEDYEICRRIWRQFQCKSIADYFKLRMKSSLLLLEDIFENFRSLLLDKYNLDPAHYYTVSSLSWDAMLKYTNVELEILKDRTMMAFFRDNIRGGILQCSKRHAVANNRFCTNFDSTKPETFIVYLDANNLSGWAMSQALPFSDFAWLNREEIKSLDVQLVADVSERGYILEVDLEYPKELHKQHNDLPFCCQPTVVPPPPAKGGELRPILSLFNKTKYVIDFRNLKQCLSHGLKLKKIHRVLTFKQCKWLQPYIAYNTQLRADAANDFETKLYKLFNNAVFGKLMQRTDKDKPIHAGYCSLELSKKFMYDFHYQVMLIKYPNRLSLLYVDTDSLVYEIRTSNFFQDLKSDPVLLQQFDTSNLDARWQIPALNKKMLGKMKEEYNGKIIREFCGVGAKVYYLDVDGEDVKKAVGVKKFVKRRLVSKEDYRNCVLRDVQIRKSFVDDVMDVDKVVLKQTTRTVLSPGDKKRIVLSDKVNTLAWGYLAS